MRYDVDNAAVFAGVDVEPDRSMLFLLYFPKTKLRKAKTQQYAPKVK